jgi:MFS family permease
MRKIALRLVPFMGLMFFINYLDRTAISFAGPNGMNQDLGLSAAQFGLASGVFFIGYILLEVPSNLALHRFGARRWLARIMVSWGIVAVITTWVQNFEQLWLLRVALGIAEAGFFPGAILFLSLWVPARHRAKIIALFFVAQPLTTVFGAPLAGWLISQDGTFGLEGWRVMFLGVGVPAVLVGILAWFVLADNPAEAKWLSDDEKAWLSRELRADRHATERHGGTEHKIGAALRNGRVWALGAVLFGLIWGFYTLAFFLPTIIAGFESESGSSFGILGRSLITAIPYLPAAVSLWVWSRVASRGRGIQPWHIALPITIGAVCVPLALLAGSPVLTMVLVTITASCLFAVFPLAYALPTRFLTSAAAAAGVALIGSIGNLAGFLAPYATGLLKDASGSYVLPMFFVGAMLLMSAVVMTVLGRRVPSVFVQRSGGEEGALADPHPSSADEALPPAADDRAVPRTP